MSQDECQCGAMKNARSRRCRKCSLDDKAARLASRLTCPKCSGPMARRAGMCRACRAAEPAVEGDGARFCGCGRPKQAASVECAACRSEKAARKVVCPSCGGPKRPHAGGCRGCLAASYGGISGAQRARMTMAGIPASLHKEVIGPLAAAPCAICGGEGRDLDHDHASGAFRGVLCSPCNKGIGLLGDNSARLAAAARYLEAPPGIAAYAKPTH